jgi:GNAT superfamily N-acetyltransferase
MDEGVVLHVMTSLSEYPPGLIGIVAALFGRCIAASHGVNWTLDAMIAEQQCEFFRRFDPARDCVWVVMKRGVPHGALTIDGPHPETGREAARLRFFILEEGLRGQGLGRKMLVEAMRFCDVQNYQQVYLTTLPGLDAALHLYYERGFILTSESQEAFHGSRYMEQTLKWTRTDVHACFEQHNRMA